MNIVICYGRMNFRFAQMISQKDNRDVASIDVSFISLKLVYHH